MSASTDPTSSSAGEGGAGAPVVLVETRAAVELITLSRPDKLNALSLAMKDELAAAIAAAIARPQTRAVVLTGAGRAFCAGADLTDLAPESSVAYRTRLRRLQETVVEAIAGSPKPFVAAVNGAAVGGGFGLAAACDLIVAAEDAYFLAPFATKVGVAADFGLAHTLTRSVGAARARSILLLGSRLDAAIAERWGLVHAVTPGDELLDAALAIAGRLAGAAPLALAATKRLLERAGHGSLADVHEHEASEQALLRLTADHQEAVAAFRERRRPHYRGL